MLLTIKDNTDPIGGFAGGRTWYGIGDMAGDPQSMHVRTIEFRTEVKLENCPAVSHQITSENKGAEPLLAYALKINQDVGGQTQIVIEAVTLNGKPTQDRYRCGITLVEQKFSGPSLDDFSKLVKRVGELERQLAPSDHVSGSAVLEAGPGSGFHALVILHWRPSRVTASMPGVQPGSFSYTVNLRDDGFELISPIYAGTFDYTAYR